jgi:hypothetical protein
MVPGLVLYFAACGTAHGLLDNNLQVVDLTDLDGDLPLDVVFTTQILWQTEDWEHPTWQNPSWPAGGGDTVGFPCVVRNDHGVNSDGKYYLYYSHHDPRSGIGVAVSDTITGPYSKNVNVPGRSDNLVVPAFHASSSNPDDPDHTASPWVVWNEQEQLWFVYFHYFNHIRNVVPGFQLTAMATTQSLASHDWTIWQSPTSGTTPQYVPVLPTTSDTWISEASTYNTVHRLIDGSWLAFLRGTSTVAGDPPKLGFASSTDARNWNYFAENPVIHQNDGGGGRAGVYRPGFIGYLGENGSGVAEYLVAWLESHYFDGDVRLIYGYTTDFKTVTRDPRGHVQFAGDDGPVGAWRENDRLYLFSGKFVHEMVLPLLPPPAPDFDFTWGASTGIFFPSLSQGILSNLGDEVVAQLYLAPDDQVDGEIFPGGGTSGDDVVLDSFVVRNNGGVLEEFGAFQKQFQAPFQSGTLYAVIFSTDSPIGGDRYYRGPGLAAPNAASQAGLFDLNVGPESGNTWTGTVVPPDPQLLVRYFASWGFSDGNQNPILPKVGDEALVQLMYSPDGAADLILPGGVPDNDDVVLDARIYRNNGLPDQEYAFFGDYNFLGPYQAGHIYGIIYEDAAPQGGHRFYAGPMMPTASGTQASPNEVSYNTNGDPTNGNTWNGTVEIQPLMRIDWRGGAGFIDERGNPILPNLGDEALVQLIYSPDGVADTILPGGLPADDDVVIDTGIVRNNGGLWEDYGLFNWIHYQGPYQPGFIYAVAYENTDPQAGARYYAGPMQATVETPPGYWVPTTYEMNIDFVLGDAWNGTVLQSFMHYQWSASFGFLDEQGNPILPNPGDHTLIQLIYSPDGLADPMLPGGVPAGNDTVLYSTTVSNSGGFREGYGFFGPISYSDSFAAGFVYGTIYQDDNPQGGERYFSGHLQATAANDVSNPHPYEMNNDLVDGDIWNRTVASGSAMSVSWYGSYGFIDEFSVPILPVVGDEAAIRLMYTPDNMRDPILPGGIPGENDVVLAADTVRNNGGQDENWAFFGALVHHGYYQAGYIYGIIYEDIDPQAGDDFYAGPLQATQTGGGTAQYDLNTDFVNGNTWNDSIIAESAMLDFDLDGLPNHFETIHFGNATIAEANVDSDFDGRLNLAEYIADTDPTNGSSFFGVESLSKDESDIVVILRDTSVNRGYVLEMDDGMFGSGSWPTADTAPAGTGAGLPFIDVGAAAESTRGYRGKVYIP